MILADARVWIDYLNGEMTPQTDLLDDCLIEGTLAMVDLIFLEILQGIRDDKQYKQVKTLRKRFSILKMGGYWMTLFTPINQTIQTKEFSFSELRIMFTWFLMWKPTVKYFLKPLFPAGSLPRNILEVDHE